MTIFRGGLFHMIPSISMARWSSRAGSLMVWRRSYWKGAWTPIVWGRRRYPWASVWNGTWPTRAKGWAW